MAVTINLPHTTKVAFQNVKTGGFFIYSDSLYQKINRLHGGSSVNICINVRSGMVTDPEAFHPGLSVFPVDVTIEVSYEEPIGDY